MCFFGKKCIKFMVIWVNEALQKSSQGFKRLSDPNRNNKRAPKQAKKKTNIVVFFCAC
jgi:hypothetical protein